MCARRATGGPRRPGDAARGPTDDKGQAAGKNRSGRARWLPRATRVARVASASGVPLVSATPKSSVMPVSEMKRETGKPAMTASGRRPAA